MAVIINFQAYVNAKDEEKRRIKRVSFLVSKRQNISGLLHTIDDCLGCSFVTKHIGELNQIVGKEHIIDNDLMNVIIAAIKSYDCDIKTEIDKLEEVNCAT